MPIGPNAKHDAHQGPREERGADKQSELSIRQAVLSLDFDADDREDRPYGEATDITERGDHQNPPAEPLERIDRVLGLSRMRGLSRLI
jgi:hypothetical protein